MDADIWSGIVANVLAGLIGLAISAAFAAATAWLAKHVSAEHLALMQTIARAAVQATEQIAAASGADPQMKLRQAIVRAQQLGAKVGVHFTEAQLRTLIEQAVHEMKQMQTVLTPPAGHTDLGG